MKNFLRNFTYELKALFWVFPTSCISSVLMTNYLRNHNCLKEDLPVQFNLFIIVICLLYYLFICTATASCNYKYRTK